MADGNGSFRFVGFLNQINQSHDHPFPDDLELDEADVLYPSSTVDSPYDYHHYESSPPSVDRNHHYVLTHRRFGLSALLADDTGSDPLATAPQLVPCFDHHTRRSSGPHQSAPVDVPAWHGRNGNSWDDDDEDEMFGEETEMVPPHVQVARSHVETPFSVLEGAGRTLKGRDLRRVRNAVWQKTGFLDI